jgi:hypothetical protein
MASLFHPQIKLGFMDIVFCMLVASSNVKSCRFKTIQLCWFYVLQRLNGVNSELSCYELCGFMYVS